MADLARRDTVARSPLGTVIGRGALAGLAGGVVFGLMMGMMGMLSMVAMLVGSDNAIVGFMVHLVISAIIGAIYGLAVANLPAARQYAPAAGLGVGYGVIWWVLGPLIIMPVMMGMGLQLGMALDPTMLMSLMGHIIYGVITALVFALLARRA